MKFLITFSAAALLLAQGILAQGTLQFNQALKIGSATQTVPAGKVWKVTSVYGAQNACTQFENAQNSSYIFKKMVETAYFVDGVKIISSSIDYNDYRFCTSGCSSCDSGWMQSTAFNATFPANPNILPMWLAAGTTLASGGANTFLSVLEFNVIP